MTRRSLIAHAGVLGLALALASCESASPRPEAATPASAAKLFTGPRIDATRGRPVVIPIASRPGAVPQVRTADGREIKARLFSIRTSGVAASAAGAEAWLGARGAWIAEEGSGPLDAAWVLWCDIPDDAAPAVIVRADDQEFEVRWLPPSSDLARPAPGSADDPWAPPRGSGFPASLLSSARVIGESLDPRTRWRWKLLADGLRPESAPGAVAVEAFESEIVEAYARQVEARWRAALGLLWEADPELAGRLKRRLAAVVNFGNGEWAPAWPTDLADLDLLASSLAGADTRPAARAARAEAWLEHQPAAYAWVADDGSTLDSARAKVLAELRIASVFDRATLAWVTPDPAPDGSSPELHDVAPMTVRALLAAPPPDGARSATRYALHVGRWEGTLAACTRPLGVEPPGFNMTPFLADWTMASWEAARPEAAAWTTAAMLHRPALPPGEEPSNARSRFWELYVECATVAGEGEQGREQVRLFVGPRERPVAVMRVAASGELVYLPVADKLSSAPELLPSPTTVTVLRGAGRWSFRVSLPPGAIEKDGIVRLGLVRTDALGRRSAWPRPLLPWESDPGRAALDTRAWQALVEPKE